MNHHPVSPAPPTIGEELPATNPSAEMLAILARRRSTPIALIGAPGPDRNAITEILRIAARVPDHRKLEPWRFIIIDCESKGDALGAELDKVRAEELGADYSDEEKLKTRTLFKRAPVAIGVVSSPDHAHKTPVWEQELSAGAACQNLLLGANAMGWAGAWLTDWCSFSKGADRVFGLGPGERIAGFIHLGTAAHRPPERQRPDLSSLISEWTPFGA